MRRRERQRLSNFIERTQHGQAGKRSTLKLGPPDPQRPFSTARHPDLTPEQCQLANTLFQRAEQARPLQGFRRACRIGGILRAIRRNLVGNSRFGHHLMGYRGGRIMQMHGLHILREIAPIGSLTARLNREKRQAQDHWERTGEVLTIGAKPTATMEQQRIETLNDAWEIAQCQTAQLEQLRW